MSLFRALILGLIYGIILLSPRRRVNRRGQLSRAVFICTRDKFVFYGAANMKYTFNRDLRLCGAVRMPFNKVILQLSRAPLAALFRITPVSGVAINHTDCAGRRLWVFEGAGLSEGSPCLLFIHGGGFGFGAAPHHKHLAAELAKRARCRVFMPDYRLLPESPFPSAREDCLAAYRFICEKYPSAKIAVMGDSAGGALTVGVCADAAANALKAPCLQLLLYPVADGTMSCPSLSRFEDAPMWSARNNAAMWRMYLDGREHTAASPLHMPLPTPPCDAFIELAQYDCLHDEGAALAERLKSLGGAVELHTISGAPHGYDMMWRGVTAKCCLDLRCAALSRAFEK